MELGEDGEVRKRYIRGNDLVYADEGEGTEKTCYVTDPHGNVVQLTDESGKVTKTYEYDSFGNEVDPEKKDDNPFRYCGEYYDKETEEIYLRARYYQPAVGRFLTRDTYTGEEDEPLSLHLYTYCGNDGVNNIDPSGHKSAKYKLYDLGHKHVGLKWMKCVYPPEQAYKLTIKIYRKEIRNSAKQNYIKKSIIQSIIYRELIFYGFEDAAADAAVALGLKNDSSTGPAQIFARYNGIGSSAERYGKETYKYFVQFKKINKKK